MALYISAPCTVSLHVLLQSGQEHKVTQFQMSCWTADGLCTSPPAIIAVIEQVLMIQRRTGNKPIVVHGRWASWLEPFLACIVIVCSSGRCNTQCQIWGHPQNEVQRACAWSIQISATFKMPDVVSWPGWNPILCFAFSTCTMYHMFAMCYVVTNYCH